MTPRLMVRPIIGRLLAPWRSPGKLWRRGAYVSLGLPVGVLSFSITITLLAISFGLMITFLIALPFVWLLFAAGRGIAAAERSRALVLLDVAVKLRADNDRIRVFDLSGDVDARGDNGSLALAGLSGNVDARSDNGDANAERMSAATARFETDNGEVRVQYDTAPMSVTALTDNGSVTVVVPRPESESESEEPVSYRVETATDNGSTNVDISSDPTSDRLIDVGTDNGDITVRYDS